MSAFERLWCPAALSCRRVGAGKKCKSQASPDFREEVTRISGSIIALRATMRCGLLFGLPTQWLIVRLSWRLPAVFSTVLIPMLLS